MIELLATHAPIRLHFLTSVLEAADIPVVVFSPGIYAQLPSRLMAPEEDAELARRLIAEAERSL